MAFAKPCRDCGMQVIWDNTITPPEGSNNRFKELETGLAHAGRCSGKQQQNMQPTTATYKLTQPTQQQGTFSPPKISPQFDDVKIANLITKVDNMNIALAQIMSNVSNIIENAGSFKDMQELKTENQQLKETIKKEGMGIKTANKIQQEQEQEQEQEPEDKLVDAGLDYAEHVRDMVKKGEEDEELEL